MSALVIDYRRCRNGKKLGIIDESVNAGIVLVAIATVTAAPLAFLRIFQAPGLKVEQSMVTDRALAAPSPGSDYRSPR